jgi:hypothetical protein
LDLIVTALIAGSFAWLSLLRRERILQFDPILVSGWITLGLLLLVLGVTLRTTPSNAIRLSPRLNAWIILVVAAALQVVAVAELWPALSEDLPRYRVEGHMWLKGVSPYSTTPQKYLDVDLSSDWASWRLHPVDCTITYPRLTSIYPPIAQLSFVLAAVSERLFPDRWWFTSGPPHFGFRNISGMAALDSSVLPFRVATALCALVTTALLISILHRGGHSAWWAVLFAWNPLAVIETGAMAHVDGLGVMLLIACVWMHQQKRFACAGIMLALAAGAKPQAAILLPWLLRDVWTSSADPLSRRRTACRLVSAFAAILFLVYVPALAYQHGYRGFLATAREYSSRWEFNGSVYETMKAYFGQGDNGLAMERAKASARLLAQAAIVLTALILWRRRATMIEAGYWLYLVGLLVSPVVYPWYLLWMLSLIPLLRQSSGWTGLVWCATVGVSYIVWHEPQWIVPKWAALVEYVPVYLALTIELAWIARRYSFTYSTSSPIFVNPT